METFWKLPAEVAIKDVNFWGTCNTHLPTKLVSFNMKFKLDLANAMESLSRKVHI